MMRPAMLMIAAIGVLVLVSIGATIFTEGAEQTPAGYGDTAEGEATAEQLEMMSMVPAYLPYGLLALAVLIIVLGCAKVLS